MEEVYLTEAIKGRLQDYDENRLSQIFSASFNNSLQFRKIFLNFIGFKGKEELVCKTQWYKFTNKRNFIDIKIFKKSSPNGNPVIVIENKIESELTNKQLKDYNGIQEIKRLKPKFKIALVKYFFEFYNENWTIIHWSEFYRELQKHVHKMKGEKDKFIIDNILNYLKKNNMALVEKISKEDLNKLADYIYLTKSIFDGSPGKKLDIKVFETASNFFTILEFICSKIKENKDFKKIIGKNIQFSPHLGDVNEDEKCYCAFTFNITLSKEYKGIKHIRTGIFFDGIGKKNKKYGIYLVKYNKSWHDLDDYYMEYNVSSKGLITEDYTNKVLVTLDKWFKK
jgi:hypothetical protein